MTSARQGTSYRGMEHTTTKEGTVPRKSKNAAPLPPAPGFDVGLEFLRARRAQNLSSMRVLEQSLRGFAELQNGLGPAGAALARISSAQAGLVRDTARVYRLATTPLAG